MTRVTLKGLAMHKTRAVLTTLAVVIGVAMISGAYVVSDTMLSAAKSLSSSAYDNTDAVVTKKQAFNQGDTVGTAVTIPQGTPIVTFAVTDAAALTTGAHVVVRGFKLPNGQITAGFVSVGKDGSVPPG